MAQCELYRLYAKAMFNTAMRITGNREDAEDVLQESFVSAFRNLSGYRGEASFGAWLKRIVVNRSITLLKRNQKALELSGNEEEEWVTPPDPEDQQLSIDAVRSAVAQLPAGFRSVLTLYLFEGYDHGEISEILEISESTSKTQYKRAKDKLKMLLKNEVNYG